MKIIWLFADTTEKIFIWIHTFLDTFLNLTRYRARKDPSAIVTTTLLLQDPVRAFSFGIKIFYHYCSCQNVFADEHKCTQFRDNQFFASRLTCNSLLATDTLLLKSVISDKTCLCFYLYWKISTTAISKRLEAVNVSLVVHTFSFKLTVFLLLLLLF
jgi:hypothetical protein